MIEFYYEVEITYIKELEAEYGKPDTMVTTSYDSALTSTDGYVIVTTTEPIELLGEEIGFEGALALAKDERYLRE